MSPAKKFLEKYGKELSEKKVKFIEGVILYSQANYILSTCVDRISTKKHKTKKKLRSNCRQVIK